MKTDWNILRDQQDCFPYFNFQKDQVNLMTEGPFYF